MIKFLASRPSGRRRLLAAAVGGVSLSLAIAACGGSSGAGAGTGTGTGKSSGAPASISQAEIDKAMSTPTELTFWTWVPNIQQEVALFEKKYPAIKVNVVNAGQGAPHYTKLRTALQAGT